MIIVIYQDKAIYGFNSFDEIKNGNEDIIKIDCSKNNLTFLPEDMIFPNLEKFNCSNNKLNVLPDKMNFPNLKEFICENNQLTTLPRNMNFPNLEILNCENNMLTTLPNMSCPYLREVYCGYNLITFLPEDIKFPQLNMLFCYYNKLTTLPKNMNLPNLEMLYFSNNKLTELPDNMNLPNLKEFSCENNKLTILPENMNLPTLKMLNINTNNIKTLPLYILNYRNLIHIELNNNPLELSPQIARFIQRIQSGSIKQFNVYNDNQNVHNIAIQTSVRDSINNITTRTDLPKYNEDKLLKMIINDDILQCKEQLIEYCNDNNVHSLLLLTFSEVLWFIMNTIENDFKEDDRKVIKTILNQEMKDAECKCFTGRMNRVVNCLNGFSKLVNIKINDSEQIGNIIFLIKERLEKENNYSVEKHKEEVRKELEERGYEKDVIDTWIEYIEE